MTWKGHRPDDRFPTARFAVFTARSLRPRFYPFHVIIRVKGLGLLASYPRRLARAWPTTGGTMPSVLPCNEASSLAMDDETYM